MSKPSRNRSGVNYPHRQSHVVPDLRTRIIHSGPGQLNSDVAHEYGKALAHCGVYLHGEKLKVYSEPLDTLEPLTTAMFPTWSEMFILPLRGTGEKAAPASIPRGIADTILKSSQFREQIPQVERIHRVSLPIRHSDGRIELLPPGYEPQAKVFTSHRPQDYSPDVSLIQARAVLLWLLKDFPFADRDRSLAVTIAVMLTVYGSGLLSPKTTIPAFYFRGNQPGVGKGLLTQIASVPVLGYTPAGVAAEDEEETRKYLFAAAMEGRPIVIFDNVVGRFESPSLESFITTSTVSGRILGSSKTLTAPKQTTVFITGNHCTLGADMERRTLNIDLFYEGSLATRNLTHHLDETELLKLRPEILASLWALIRDWRDHGCPRGSYINHNFPTWSATIGSILEHAGFRLS